MCVKWISLDKIFHPMLNKSLQRLSYLYHVVLQMPGHFANNVSDTLFSNTPHDYRLLIKLSGPERWFSGAQPWLFFHWPQVHMMAHNPLYIQSLGILRPHLVQVSTAHMRFTSTHSDKITLKKLSKKTKCLNIKLKWQNVIIFQIHAFISVFQRHLMFNLNLTFL